MLGIYRSLNISGGLQVLNRSVCVCECFLLRLLLIWAHGCVAGLIDGQGQMYTDLCSVI